MGCDLLDLSQLECCDCKMMTTMTLSERCWKHVVIEHRRQNAERCHGDDADADADDDDQELLQGDLDFRIYQLR